MRKLAVILILSLSGCSEKETVFTFYKWNMRESYYLKFNSSDTLYCFNSFEEKNSYTILKDDEKRNIQNILDSISFPKNKINFDRDVNDGETFAFILKQNNNSLKKVRIHAFAGPNQFWAFGRLLDSIKIKHKFIETNKKIEISEMDSMVITKVTFIKK